jgi:hypothetical protein
LTDVPVGREFDVHYLLESKAAPSGSKKAPRNIVVHSAASARRIISAEGCDAVANMHRFDFTSRFGPDGKLTQLGKKWIESGGGAAAGGTKKAARRFRCPKGEKRYRARRAGPTGVWEQLCNSESGIAALRDTLAGSSDRGKVAVAAFIGLLLADRAERARAEEEAARVRAEREAQAAKLRRRLEQQLGGSVSAANIVGSERRARARVDYAAQERAADRQVSRYMRRVERGQDVPSSDESSGEDRRSRRVQARDAARPTRDRAARASRRAALGNLRPSESEEESGPEHGRPRRAAAPARGAMSEVRGRRRRKDSDDSLSEGSDGWVSGKGDYSVEPSEEGEQEDASSGPLDASVHGSEPGEKEVSPPLRAKAPSRSAFASAFASTDEDEDEEAGGAEDEVDSIGDVETHQSDIVGDDGAQEAAQSQTSADGEGPSPAASPVRAAASSVGDGAHAAAAP